MGLWPRGWLVIGAVLGAAAIIGASVIFLAAGGKDSNGVAADLTDTMSSLQQSATYLPSYTPAETATQTEAPSATPASPTATPTLTATNTPTDTPEPSSTPSETPVSPTLTATNTPTETPEPSHTPSPTATRLPTATSSPTPDAVTSAVGVIVPAGEYQAGSAGGDLEALPLQTIVLDSFIMDTTEVTNAAYEAFLISGGYENQALWSPEGWNWLQSESPPPPATDQASLPVTVTWYEADAYCRWRDARLPTQIEWEVAAGWNADNRKFRFPWGDTPPDATLLNFNGNIGNPVPVGSYPPNALGLYDMAGNLREWVADSIQSERYGVRGGSYLSAAESVQIAAQTHVRAVPPISDVGFRCVAAP